jgi:glycosyltransferase involved in cell wall biosynthesis
VKILTGIDVPFRPFGGSLLQANDWYSNLPEGVEVRFLTLPAPKTEKWWSIEDVVMLDIEKARTSEGFMDYVETLKELVKEQIEDFKPDVIHCQHLNYGLSRAIAELDVSIPKIGICHGTDVQIATSSSFFKDNLEYICDRMDLLLFPNQTMTDDFFATYKKEKPYKINPLGIPDAFFDATPRRLSFEGKGIFNLLYAGRLLGWKGADIAVSSLKYVKNDIHLTVIGNEDQAGYKNEMQDFVTRNNLQNKVVFKDQLPREQLLHEFSHFDAIIFPSRSLEAFSLTTVEAQAKGLPVIFNPGGGITDTVGDSGIKILKNDPRGIAQLLDDIYKHPEKLKDIQTRGYLNAAKYTSSQSQKNLFTLSQSLIAHRVD